MNRIIADLHIHSCFSRATSKTLNLENMYKWAQLKGIHIVGCGDFTHPSWLGEIKEKLEPAEDGLFKLKPEYSSCMDNEIPVACKNTVRFILSAEISNIYKKGDRIRKIHNIILMPDISNVTKLQYRLEKIGNIRADGRPILGISAYELLKILLDITPQAVLIPAHIWTPWFSVLGSKSGFDSIEECFEDLTEYIFAIETGLSSDPPMNWRLSSLDRFAIVSNSDAHSLEKLAREATIFPGEELSYNAIFETLRTNNVLGTIEFFPEEGKYHFDGHRRCQVRLDPITTKTYHGLCPVCKEPVTVGVMNRVESLADRDRDIQDKPRNARPYYSLIPLIEILSEIDGSGVNSKKVKNAYHTLLSKIGPELKILMDVPIEEIKAKYSNTLAEAIKRMRKGEVYLQPGYDGEYGIIKIFPEKKQALPLFITTDKEDDEKNINHENNKHISQQQVTVLSSDNDDKLSQHIPELSTEQLKIVHHTHGQILVVSGPGTGKTRTLTARIAYLINQNIAQPDEILAITFTNKAADEMRDRLVTLLNKQLVCMMTIKTFHSLGLSILKEEAKYLNISSAFVVLDDTDRLALLGEIITNKKTIQHIANKISISKANLVYPQECIHDEEFMKIYTEYQRLLNQYNAMDYDDLILNTVRLLENECNVLQKYRDRFKWISVDEYQDLNLAQYTLLRLLAPNEDTTNLCVIGDPNQAIYGFRGASVKFFYKFKEDYPNAKITELTQNYRSTDTILDASLQVILKASDRRQDVNINLWSEIVSNTKINIHYAPTDKAEAEFVAHEIEKLIGGIQYFSFDSKRVVNRHMPQICSSFSDIAVLYRLNEQSRPLIEAFDRLGIPYQTAGEMPFTQQPEIKDVISWLRIIQYPELDMDMQRVLDTFAGITEDDINRIKHIAITQNKSIFEVISNYSGINPYVNKCSNTINELTSMAKHTRLVDILHKVMHNLSHIYPDTCDNWNRLIDIAKGFDSISEFLEYILLQKEVDVYQEHAEQVALMSIHASKGLEFPVVFITGCEENIIPYMDNNHRDKNDEINITKLDEERRLFYVGMTRAQKMLFLTCASSRVLFGKCQQNKPSCFLSDIEKTIIQIHHRNISPKKKKKRYVQESLFSGFDT